MVNQPPKPETKPTPEEALERVRGTKKNGIPETNGLGIYEDHPEAVSWTTRSNAASLLREKGVSISNSTMCRKMSALPESPFKIIVATNNRAEIGVRLIDAEEAARSISRCKIIVPESGIHTSKRGKTWISVTALKRKHGISKTRQVVREVKSIDARTHTGRPTKLYNMEAAEAKLQPLIKKIKRGVQIDQNGCYSNKEGTWITPIKFFAGLTPEQQQKTSQRSLRRFAQNKCKSLPVITLDGDGNKKLTNQNVHPLDELKEMPALAKEATDITLTPLENVEVVRNEVRSSEEILTGNIRTRVMEMLASDKWSEELKRYAYDRLMPYVYTDQSITELEDKLNFLQENVPLPLLRNPDLELTNLFFTSANYLRAMRRYLGESGWLEVLEDPEKCHKFRKASKSSPSTYLSEECYADFARRSAGITASDEINDVLVATGTDKIARPIVNEIVMSAPSASDKASGKWRGQIGEVEIKIGLERKQFLIPTILHELGHAFEDRIAWDEEASEIFNRYIVVTQLEPTVSSSYAMSYKLSDEFLGENDNPGFIGESFAEDFKLFWMKPESLSDRKSAILKELCDMLYPDIDRDEVRKKIRSTLGNYYGKSVNEVVWFSKCLNPEEYAVYLDRKRAEEKRDEE